MFLNRWGMHQISNLREFLDRQLEPELSDLVDDDEIKHRPRWNRCATLSILQPEQVIEA